MLKSNMANAAVVNLYPQPSWSIRCNGLTYEGNDINGALMLFSMLSMEKVDTKQLVETLSIFIDQLARAIYRASDDATRSSFQGWKSDGFIALFIPLLQNPEIRGLLDRCTYGVRAQVQAVIIPFIHLVGRRYGITTNVSPTSILEVS